MITSYAELHGIDYCAEGKEVDISIRVESCGYTVDTHEKMILIQKQSGKVDALEKEDKGGAIHFLKFE
jgi:hypothetical protein